MAANGIQDSGILVSIRDGNDIAFNELVLIYDAPLRSFARRIMRNTATADDIVQDVFVWLWEHRATLNPTTTLRSYLYGAVRNRALHLLRRERLEEDCAVRFDPGTGIPGMGVPLSGTASATERAELAVALTKAFASLSPRVRQVSLLRWRDGLSRKEIADVMGVAEPTVNNQLTQAARVLRGLLAGHIPE